ncbi:hypothetical protein SAMN04488587_0241 [Methanococcoides vulcani]|uniref:Uncharacterized protein n=1 Tax=Methanococcoides vulcani TaxID=1353158 RepID=A0A1H9Y4U5_9EURY|nr:hypothetical protein SAMN04488587_0241 [Methanococcoides vulcani]
MNCLRKKRKIDFKAPTYTIEDRILMISERRFLLSVIHNGKKLNYEKGSVKMLIDYSTKILI